MSTWAHQVVPETLTSPFAVGFFRGAHFVAYGVGRRVVILSSNLVFRQELCTLDEEVSAEDISVLKWSPGSGRLAVALGQRVGLFFPKLTPSSSTRAAECPYDWQFERYLDHGEDVSALCWFSPSSLATAGKRVSLWTCMNPTLVHPGDTWQLTWTIDCGLEPLVHIDAHNREVFATAGAFDRLVKVWDYDVTRGAQTTPRSLYLAHPQAVMSISWLKNGARSDIPVLLTLCRDDRFRVWSHATHSGVPTYFMSCVVEAHGSPFVQWLGSPRIETLLEAVDPSNLVGGGGDKDLPHTDAAIVALNRQGVLFICSIHDLYSAPRWNVCAKAWHLVQLPFTASAQLFAWNFAAVELVSDEALHTADPLSSSFHLTLKEHVWMGVYLANTQGQMRCFGLDIRELLRQRADGPSNALVPVIGASNPIGPPIKHIAVFDDPVYSYVATVDERGSTLFWHLSPPQLMYTNELLTCMPMEHAMQAHTVAWLPWVHEYPQTAERRAHAVFFVAAQDEGDGRIRLHVHRMSVTTTLSEIAPPPLVEERAPKLVRTNSSNQPPRPRSRNSSRPGSAGVVATPEHSGMRNVASAVGNAMRHLSSGKLSFRRTGSNQNLAEGSSSSHETPRPPPPAIAVSRKRGLSSASAIPVPGGARGAGAAPEPGIFGMSESPTKDSPLRHRAGATPLDGHERRQETTARVEVVSSAWHQCEAGGIVFLHTFPMQAPTALMETGSTRYDSTSALVVAATENGSKLRCWAVSKSSGDDFSFESLDEVHMAGDEIVTAAAPVCSIMGKRLSDLLFHFATGSADGRVRLWQLAMVEGKTRLTVVNSFEARLKSHPEDASAAVSAVRCHPRRIGVSLAGRTGNVDVWECESRAPEWAFEATLGANSSKVYFDWLDARNGCNAVLAVADGVTTSIYGQAPLQRFAPRSAEWTQLHEYKRPRRCDASVAHWLSSGTLLVCTQDGLALHTGVEGDRSHQATLFKQVDSHASILPDFHPRVLRENLATNQFARVAKILRYLLTFLATVSDDQDPDEMVPRDVCVPRMPVDDVFAEAPVAVVGTGVGAAGAAEGGDAVFSGFGQKGSLFSKGDSAQYKGLFSIFGDEKAATTDSLSTEDAAILSTKLGIHKLSGLKSREQTELIAIVDSFTKLEAERRSLDECGFRFMIAVRIFQLLSKTLPATERPTCLPFHEYAWALQSLSQETIVSLCDDSLQTWEGARALGLGWWLQNPILLRTVIEKIARQQYLANKDPVDCALLYMALGKKSALAGLYKQSGNTRMYEFVTQNFALEKNKVAAQKNAYKLLGQQKSEYACAFFLMTNQVSDVVRMCLNDLQDAQLALVIARLVEGTAEDAGPSFTSLLLNDVLPPALETGDVWQASVANWLLKRYREATQALLPEDIVPESMIANASKAADATANTTAATTSILRNTTRKEPPAFVPSIVNYITHVISTIQVQRAFTPGPAFRARLDRLRLCAAYSYAHAGCPVQAVDVLRSVETELHSAPLPKRKRVDASQPVNDLSAFGFDKARAATLVINKDAAGITAGRRPPPASEGTATAARVVPRRIGDTPGANRVIPPTGGDGGAAGGVGGETSSAFMAPTAAPETNDYTSLFSRNGEAPAPNRYGALFGGPSQQDNAPPPVDSRASYGGLFGDAPAEPPAPATQTYAGLFDAPAAAPATQSNTNYGSLFGPPAAAPPSSTTSYGGLFDPPPADEQPVVTRNYKGLFAPTEASAASGGARSSYGGLFDAPAADPEPAPAPPARTSYGLFDAPVDEPSTTTAAPAAPVAPVVVEASKEELEDEAAVAGDTADQRSKALQHMADYKLSLAGSIFCQYVMSRSQPAAGRHADFMQVAQAMVKRLQLAVSPEFLIAGATQYCTVQYELRCKAALAPSVIDVLGRLRLACADIVATTELDNLSMSRARGALVIQISKEAHDVLRHLLASTGDERPSNDYLRMAAVTVSVASFFALFCVAWSQKSFASINTILSNPPIVLTPDAEHPVPAGEHVFVIPADDSTDSPHFVLLSPLAESESFPSTPITRTASGGAGASGVDFATAGPSGVASPGATDPLTDALHALPSPRTTATDQSADVELNMDVIDEPPIPELQTPRGAEAPFSPSTPATVAVMSPPPPAAAPPPPPPPPSLVVQSCLAAERVRMAVGFMQDRAIGMRRKDAAFYGYKDEGPVENAVHMTEALRAHAAYSDMPQWRLLVLLLVHSLHTSVRTMLRGARVTYTSDEGAHQSPIAGPRQEDELARLSAVLGDVARSSRAWLAVARERVEQVPPINVKAFRDRPLGTLEEYLSDMAIQLLSTRATQELWQKLCGGPNVAPIFEALVLNR